MHLFINSIQTVQPGLRNVHSPLFLSLTFWGADVTMKRWSCWQTLVSGVRRMETLSRSTMLNVFPYSSDNRDMSPVRVSGGGVCSFLILMTRYIPSVVWILFNHLFRDFYVYQTILLRPTWSRTPERAPTFSLTWSPANWGTETPERLTRKMCHYARIVRGSASKGNVKWNTWSTYHSCK